MPEDILAA
jgi:hypothetical protein